MQPFLQMSGITKRYGGIVALEGVDLDISPGEVHCLAGENGSGKSTLIKIISGVTLADSGGKIAILGKDRTGFTARDSINAGVQVIYQDLSLFPNLTVAENIALPAKTNVFGRHRRNKDVEVARRTTEQLGISLALDRSVGELSIAARQLVAIARALSQEAKLLIMDEPTASLSPKEVARLLALVLDLKARGVAVIFVSHKLDEVLSISDRVTVLRDGKKLGTFPADDMTSDRLSELMTGKVFAPIELAPVPSAPAVLQVFGLSRSGEFTDISFDLSPGEVLGITGPMGAGKTELAHVLFGLQQPLAGQIRMGGKEISFRSNRDAMSTGICYLPEDRLTEGLVAAQPIAENILVALHDRLAVAAGYLPSASCKEMVEAWVSRLAIKTKDVGNPITSLSGGNQQRVALAKWMARLPRVLILDSPTVGVDVNAKDGIYEIIRSQSAEGVAVILISDEIPEVYNNAHRILVMREGRIVGQFEPKVATLETVREAAYG